MVSTRWTQSNKTVYNIGYHIIWCPKYKRKVLVGEVEKRLRELIQRKAGEIDVSIETLEVMPDHLHLFIKAPPTASPHWIVQQLKGYSSHELRKEFEPLRTRLPTLWTRSYYVESYGHISGTAVKKYVEEQKNQ